MTISWSLALVIVTASIMIMLLSYYITGPGQACHDYASHFGGLGGEDAPAWPIRISEPLGVLGFEASKM